MPITPLNITSLASTAEIDQCLGDRTEGCVPLLGEAYRKGNDDEVKHEVDRQLAQPGGATRLVDRAYFTGVCKLNADNECDVPSYYRPPEARAAFVERWAVLPDPQRNKLLAEAASQDKLLAGAQKKHPMPSVLDDMLHKFVAHDLAVYMRLHPMGDIELYLKTHPA